MMRPLNPYASTIRPQPQVGMSSNPERFGLGSILERLRAANPQMEAGPRVPQGTMTSSAIKPQVMGGQASIDNSNFRPAPRVPQQAAQVLAEPTNPFEGNEQYQALMEYQQSLAPTQEQRDRLQELQSAFEGTGAFKDYRINQLQQQLQQRQPRNPMMGMGLGMANPYGMQPYQGFGRPQFPMQPMPMPRGGYNQYQQQPYYQGPNFNQGPTQLSAMQQQYANPYQQMRPQPQQFGGYGMGQQMGGYGSFGGMPNPYQPQQMGYNQNNYSGYSGMQNFASFG